jgi:hypothetical protein
MRTNEAVVRVMYILKQIDRPPFEVVWAYDPDSASPPIELSPADCDSNPMTWAAMSFNYIKIHSIIMTYFDIYIL